MQKAWYYDEYGSKEVLKVGDVAVPSPGANQMLVQVRAAALNPIDFKLRRNPLGPIDLPVVPGCDVAGVVVSTGHNVTKFKAGAEVYANIQDFDRKNRLKQLGTLAQFTLVEEYLAASKPKTLSFEEAASLPVAAQTAFEGFKISSFKEKTSVFVVGGAGGVGSLAVQMAKKVFKASSVGASTSTGKVEFVKGLGADNVLDYTKIGYEDFGERYDLVYDTIGDSRNSYVLAKESGEVIDITWPPSNPRARHSGLTASGEVLERMKPFLESGEVGAVIDPAGPFHFNDAVKAFGYLETGRARGKVVISSFPSLS